MRKLNCILTFMLGAALLLIAVNIILAQQPENQRQSSQRQGRRGEQGNQNQRQRGQQMDTAETLNQMMERVLGQLKLSETEATVIKPKIQVVMQLRIDQSGEIRELTRALREAIDTKNSELTKSKLAELKTKRKEYKAKIEALETELIELLSVEQEAELTILGVVNNDSSELRVNRGQGQRNQTDRQSQQ
jgi:hypothetical protein